MSLIAPLTDHDADPIISHTRHEIRAEATTMIHASEAGPGAQGRTRKPSSKARETQKETDDARKRKASVLLTSGGTQRQKDMRKKQKMEDMENNHRKPAPATSAQAAEDLKGMGLGRHPSRLKHTPQAEVDAYDSKLSDPPDEIITPKHKLPPSQTQAPQTGFPASSTNAKITRSSKVQDAAARDGISQQYSSPHPSEADTDRQSEGPGDVIEDSQQLGFRTPPNQITGRSPMTPLTNDSAKENKDPKRPQRAHRRPFKIAADVDEDPRSKWRPITCTFFWDNTITTRVNFSLSYPEDKHRLGHPGGPEDIMAMTIEMELDHDGFDVSTVTVYDIRMIWPWHGGWTSHDGMLGMRRETRGLGGKRLLRQLELAFDASPHAYLQFKLRRKPEDDETEKGAPEAETQEVVQLNLKPGPLEAGSDARSRSSQPHNHHNGATPSPAPDGSPNDVENDAQENVQNDFDGSHGAAADSSDSDADLYRESNGRVRPKRRNFLYDPFQEDIPTAPINPGGGQPVDFYDWTRIAASSRQKRAHSQ